MPQATPRFGLDEIAVCQLARTLERIAKDGAATYDAASLQATRAPPAITAHAPNAIRPRRRPLRAPYRGDSSSPLPPRGGVLLARR